MKVSSDSLEMTLLQTAMNGSPNLYPLLCGMPGGLSYLIQRQTLVACDNNHVLILSYLKSGMERHKARVTYAEPHQRQNSQGKIHKLLLPMS